LATATAAAVAFAVAITTPPRSGPNCTSGCIDYPYTDAAAFVPRDYVWMYPATLACGLALGLLVCIHAAAPAQRRPLALASVSFGAIGVGALVVDYGIQLTVLQPALLRGETDGMSAWSQYNPHGVFIALENIGYVTVSLALLMAGLALRASAPSAARSMAVRTAAWVFAVAGAATLVLLPVLGAAYRANLDYRFEVFSLTVTWLALVAGGVALSLASPRSGW
jgi:hypothetical protein